MVTANKARFCAAFGMARNHIFYATYWDSIVGRLENCSWWANPAPRDDEERAIAAARAAFLDAIFYEPLPA